MLRESFHASVILGLLLVADSGAREWTDSTGVFTVEATLVEVSGDSVRLRMQNGIMVQVPIERLCRADQQYVQSMRQNPNPPTNEALVAIDKALETKVSFDFVDTPLDYVTSHLAKLTNIAIEIDVGLIAICYLSCTASPRKGLLQGYKKKASSYHMS